MDVINVVSYGATGNGSTDDRAAIQNAIDDGAVLGKAVFFRPASVAYLIGGALELHTGTKLIGDHTCAWMPGGVSFRQPLLQAKSTFADGAMIQVYDSSLTGDAVDPNGGSIRGLCLYGAGFAPAGQPQIADEIDAAGVVSGAARADATTPGTSVAARPSRSPSGPP